MGQIVKTIIIAVVLAAALGCGESETMFLIQNTEAQKSLITSLEKRNIMVRIREKGEVWFALKHEKLVHDLAFEIMSASKPSRDTFAYAEPRYTELLIEKLEKESVPFEIRYRKGVKNISLSYENEAQWTALKNEVDDLFVSEKIQEIEQNK